MTASRQFGLFTIAFAITYPIVYITAMEVNLALFTYHPAIGEFGWGADKPRGGPAMYWYGWMSTSALAALAVGLMCARLPESLTRMLPAALAWVVPFAAMITAAGLTAHFLLR